jgi:hypothetical protein
MRQESPITITEQELKKLELILTMLNHLTDTVSGMTVLQMFQLWSTLSYKN